MVSVVNEWLSGSGNVHMLMLKNQESTLMHFSFSPTIRLYLQLANNVYVWACVLYIIVVQLML